MVTIREEVLRRSHHGSVSPAPVHKGHAMAPHEDLLRDVPADELRPTDDE